MAIVGQQARVAMGSDFQQELNMERLFGDVAEYVKSVTAPMQAQLVVDRAIRIAMAYRKPTVIILPADVQDLEWEEPCGRALRVAYRRRPCFHPDRPTR